MPNQCQKCGKEVVWLYHKDTKKPAPIEAEPSVNGNILVKNELYRIAAPCEIEKAKAIGKPLFLNHFATCEFAQSFSKKAVAAVAAAGNSVTNETPKNENQTPKCKECGCEMRLIENETLWFCPLGCSKRKNNE